MAAQETDERRGGRDGGDYAAAEVRYEVVARPSGPSGRGGGRRLRESAPRRVWPWRAEAVAPARWCREAVEAADAEGGGAAMRRGSNAGEAASGELATRQ
jgi:hypothetical protein